MIYKLYVHSSSLFSSDYDKTQLIFWGIVGGGGGAKGVWRWGGGLDSDVLCDGCISLLHV